MRNGLPSHKAELTRSRFPVDLTFELTGPQRQDAAGPE